MAQVKSGQLILAAVLAIFVYGMIAAMLGTVLPSFPFTPAQASTIALAQAIGLIVASVSAGPIIDIRGKKLALVGGLFLIAVSLFILGNAGGEYNLVMFSFLLVGLGGGVLVTAANALASDVNEERRASTLNFLNLFFGLGGIATPFIATSLLNNNPVSIAYTAAALSAGVFLLHLVTPMPPPTGQVAFQASEIGKLMGRPALWLLSLLLFLYVACEIGVWNWLVKFLTAPPVSIPQTTAAQILALGFALGILIGRVVVSRILVKVPAITVTLASAMLMAVTTFLMLQSSSALMAAVVVFCAGLSMAPVFPTTLAMVGDAFPVMTATAMGLVITFGWIGLAVSSAIIGQIAGGEDSRLGTALLVLPVFSVLMVVVNLALRPMLAKTR